MKIKVMLVDNQLVVRQGLKTLLLREPDIEVVAESANVTEAAETAGRLKPDVVILETAVSRPEGPEAIRAIKEAGRDCEILVLTGQNNKNLVRDALQAGAKGYVLKTASFAEILSAIRVVHGKSYYLSPEISAEIIDTFVKKQRKDTQTEPYERLSRREKEVFRLIAEGKTTDEIADMLSISPKTVAKHRMNIMEKLQLKNTATLVRYAARLGILEP